MKKKMLVVLMAALVLSLFSFGMVSADDPVVPALVSVGHGIPGIDLGLDPELPVDVIVDGKCFLQDFKFGDFAGPVELPAGDYEIAVALSDGDPVLCGGSVAIGPVTLTFEAGVNYTVFAHLTDAGAPTASLFVNDVSNAVAGYTRLTVRHTAWAPAVDLLVNRGWVSGREIGFFEGLTNPNQLGPVDLRPGAYAVSIFPSGGDEAVFQVPATEEDEPLVTKPHLSQIVYAVGSLENSTFTLMIQTFGLGITPPGRPMMP